jgi:hypothetical protein
MKTLKTFALTTLVILFGQSVFANPEMNVACSVTDSRFNASTGLKQLLIDDIYNAEPYSNFPKTKKHGETIVTDNYITMAFSNPTGDYYVFSLEKNSVDAAVAEGGGAVEAEVRFTNENTKEYEKYLRDGQLLKTLMNCYLEVM